MLSLRRQWARRATFTAYAVLLLLLTSNTLIWPPLDKEPSVIIWAIQVIPLLLVLPGIWRGGYRAHLWLCFIVLLYFMTAVTNAFTPGYGWRPWAEIGAVAIIFTGAMLYARWQQQRLAEGA